MARAAEFEALAEEVRADERAIRFVRERITLARRDIAKMIAAGIEEDVPVSSPVLGRLDLGWTSMRSIAALVARIPRSGGPFRNRADRAGIVGCSPSRFSTFWKLT